ncbi:L-type lectin-domain containing receptor kinase S.6 [Bienertia sinuspersici]
MQRTSSSSKSIFLKLIIIIFVFNFNFDLIFSFPFYPTNITLFGDACFIKNSKFNISSISLTKQHPSSSGRAFYNYPLQFLDTLTNSTISFSSRFSFTITPSSISNPGIR